MATEQVFSPVHDQSIGTYITDYILTVIEWNFAFILLFKIRSTKQQSKFNLFTDNKKAIVRNRTYFCAIFFIFQGASELTAGLCHQYFTHSYEYPNTATGFYVTVILTILLFQIGNWLSFIMIGPIHQNKCCNQISIRKIWCLYLVIIWYSYLVFILAAMNFTAPYMYSFFMVGITSVIVSIYFMFYALNILYINNYKCINSNIAQWFYICYGIVITFSSLVIQIVFRHFDCENSNNDNNCLFHENFDHNAWFHIGQIIGAVLLFIGVILEYKSINENSEVSKSETNKDIKNEETIPMI